MDKSVIKKATSDSSDPTMGHLYRDIAEMTFADGRVSVKLADYLMDTRLKKAKSKHQIIKCLKVIKHVANSGHSDFQKYLQKRSEELKEYSNYKAAPDAVYGEALNAQVKATAREAIDALYQERRTVNGVGVNSITGLGGGAVDKTPTDEFAPFKGGGVASQPMQGFGSTTGASKFKEEFQKVNHTAPPDAAGAAAAGASYLAQLGTAAKSGFGLYGVAPVDDLTARIQKTEFAQYTSVAIDATASYANAAAPAPAFKFLQEGGGGGAAAATVTVSDTAVSLNRAEQIVDAALLKGDGLGRTELARFVQEAREVDEEGLGDDLTARLDSKLRQEMLWSVRLHALALLEGLVKNGVEYVVEYFTENPEDVYRNVNVVQDSVKKKAKKCLAALGLPAKQGNLAVHRAVEDEPAPVTAEGPVAETVVDPRTGLVRKRSSVGLGTGKLNRRRKSSLTSPAPTVSHPAEGHMDPAADGGGGGGDLFEGLTTIATPPAEPLAAPPAAAPPAALGIFGLAASPAAPQPPFASAAPAPAVPAAPQPPADPFAFATASPVAAAPPAVPPPAAAAAPAPAASSLEFLFGTGTPAAAAAAPAPAAPALPVVQPTPPATASNTMDFLFGDAPKPAPKPASAAAAPAPAAAAADPFAFEMPGSSPPQAAPASAAPQAAAPVPVPQVWILDVEVGEGVSCGEHPPTHTRTQPTVAAFPMAAAPAAAPAGGDLASQAALIADPAARMRFIQEQQAALAAQIAALQGR